LKSFSGKNSSPEVYRKKWFKRESQHATDQAAGAGGASGSGFAIPPGGSLVRPATADHEPHLQLAAHVPASELQQLARCPGGKTAA